MVVATALFLLMTVLFLVVLLSLARFVFGLTKRVVIIAAIVLGVLWLLSVLSIGTPSFA